MNGIFNFLCTDFLEIYLADSITYNSGTTNTFNPTIYKRLSINTSIPDKDGNIVPRMLPFINIYTRYDIYLTNERFLGAKIKDITFDNKMIIETPKIKEKVINIFSITEIVNTGIVYPERQRNFVPSHLEITVNCLGEEKLIKCYLVGIGCIKNNGIQLLVINKGDVEEKVIYINPSDIIQIKKKRG